MIDLGKELRSDPDVIPSEVETTAVRGVPPLRNQLPLLVPEIEIRLQVAPSSLFVHRDTRSPVES